MRTPYFFTVRPALVYYIKSYLCVIFILCRVIILYYIFIVIIFMKVVREPYEVIIMIKNSITGTITETQVGNIK